MRFLFAAPPNYPPAAPSLPLSLSSFDIATLFLVTCLLLFSSLSLLFVLHLRRRPHLSRFAPLSPARLTLVALVSIWAVHQILRLPFFAPTDAACKLHVIVSLGIFEPAFLLAILSLLNLSVRKPGKIIYSILIPLIPTLALQIFFVVFFPSQWYSRKFPSFFLTSSFLSSDQSLICTCPLFSTATFAGFFLLYCLAFLVTYWKVTNLVIHRGTTIRIHILTLCLFVCISIQIMIMAGSAVWRFHGVTNGFVSIGIFGIVAVCVVVSESILVVKPIMDALSFGGAR